MANTLFIQVTAQAEYIDSYTPRVKVRLNNSPDSLHYKMWVFEYLFHMHKLVVDRFVFAENRYDKVVGIWNRIDQRGNTIEFESPPAEVIELARSEFMRALRVEGG